MQCNFHIVLTVAWAVAMVTSAPLSTQEKLVNVEQAGNQVNRAKRADEEIVFGNQQNKARVVAKKSDLSNILAPAQLPGEVDQGSEVIVHKEIPVTEALASRAEAAAGSASENNEKIKEAVEAALQSVAEDEAEKTETAAADQESVEKSNTDDNANKQLADEENDEENEQGTGEVSEAVEDTAPEADGDDEDEALKELQRAAEGNAAAAQGNDGSNDEPSSLDDSNEGDETERFLQESQKPEEEGEVSLDRDRERAYVNQMRNYLMSMNNGRGYHRFNSPYLYRYRRSLDFSRKSTPSKNNKRTRRIKRDLLDDRYYGPYELPYIPSEYPDLNSDSEDFVPLTDDEAEYVYKQLVNYLANDYTPEQEEPERDTEGGSLDSYLNGYEQDENEPYAPYVTYNEDAVPYAPSVYEDKYQYGPLDVVGLAKRGLVDYYPYEEEEKRYFFPFNKEPETHWGAFVPEKRDYDEAIQRLQRLAMALSDNPGPYYREILEEYRRK